MAWINAFTRTNQEYGRSLVAALFVSCPAPTLTAAFLRKRNVEQVIVQCDTKNWVKNLGDRLRLDFTVSLSGAYHDRDGAREGSSFDRRWADHALSA